jgi:glutamine amidotransferase
MIKVCILDYGSGNVKSVKNAFAQFAECSISNHEEDIRDASHLVLPGVGSYKKSMQRIFERIPINVVQQQASNGKPLLGICVGMQVLGETGIEFEKAEGLGVFSGVVSRIDSGTLPLPHVGWNNLVDIEDNPITTGVSSEDDFYFVHSNGFTVIQDEFVLAKAVYGSSFPAIISEGNTYGVQFHPEKSQKAGNKLIENFLRIR